MISLLHHDRSLVDRMAAFHGGLCPSLALGIQVSRVALEEVGANGRDHEVHADGEDDSCGIDAVQMMTGCTLGNRDLRILPYGKFAFTFHRRADGKTVRIATRPTVWDWDAEHLGLFARVQAGVATADQLVRFRAMHRKQAEAILEARPAELLTVTNTDMVPPARAYSPRPSVACSVCAELVESARVREVGDKAYCATCAPAS